MNKVLQEIRRAGFLSEGTGASDGQLLEAFITRREELAFEALVRRHGPMVLGVCRRVLGNEHDAEDAFQAAFLVLVRKAAALRCRDLVGNWLYGVAYRTALKAKTLAARRRDRERNAPRPAPPPEAADADLLRLLDQELYRLPDKYRAAILLCDLEGRSRREAARLLRIAEGTLSSRLAAARNRLAQRLGRHGPAFSGGALAAVLAQNTAAAGAPAPLVLATVRSATAFTAGQAIPATLAVLTEGVLRTMEHSKLKSVTALLFGLCLAGTAAGGLSFLEAPAEQPDRRPRSEAARLPADERREERPAEQARQGDQARDAAKPASGKEVTRELKIADFTALDVSGIFRVNVSRADGFRVAVTAEEALFPHVKVVKKGGTLHLSLDTQGKSVRTQQPLQVTITMPRLEGVRLSGVSRVAVTGFKSDGNFQASLSGASRLQGTLTAGGVKIASSGASRVSLAGSARDAKLSAGGASRLDLARLALQAARVTLTGAARAAVNARAKLDYVLSGAARLTYQGKPTVGKKSTTGVSRASPSASNQGEK
jgi:RNA polymerase sigma factor (sigma-70 family)